MNTPTVPMIATVRQTYNTRALKSGDSFDAVSEADAADLVAVRMAQRAKPKARLLGGTDTPAPARVESAPPAAVLTTRNLEAADTDAPATDVDATEINTARGGYSRRDVRPKR